VRFGAAIVVVCAACGADAPLEIAGGGTPVDETPALVGERFSPPVPNPAAISSTFGPRWKTSASRYDFHPGIDYVDAPGTPVLAIGPGVIEGVFPDGSSTYPLGGNVVVVRHPIAPRRFHGATVDHVFAVYLHLQSFAVAIGDSVVAGQPVGAMGMTGDTEFVHLHFEVRVQTTCSLSYQVAHPESSCALGFDPHVHPFLFVGGANADGVAVAELSSPNAFRYTATRDDLDLDVIATDRGTVGFSERAGLDATSLERLDDFDLGWLRIVPQPFTSESTEIVYDLYFAAAPRYLELRDIYGRGLRFE
jgi:hypothetical protein